MSEFVKDSIESLEAAYKAQAVEINGRQYKLHPMTHRDRSRVLGFVSGIGARRGPLDFLGTAEWEPIEKILYSAVSLDNMILAKAPDHFEVPNGYPEDFMPLLEALIELAVYPFVRGRRGDSGAPARPSKPI